jgi:hypothetical protein
MKYLKLYEEFKSRFLDEEEIIEQPELSDKTVDDLDDILSDIEEEELESDEIRIDNKGVYHIKNWKVY